MKKFRYYMVITSLPGEMGREYYWEWKVEDRLAEPPVVVVEGKQPLPYLDCWLKAKEAVDMLMKE